MALSARRRSVVAITAALLAATPLAISSGPPQLARAGTSSPPAPESLGAAVLIGALGAPGEEFDHVAMVWDELIDPGSIPDPASFSVTINGIPATESDVTLVYSGFAGEALFGPDPDQSFGIDGASFMTIDLLPPQTWTTGDSVLLSYTAGANPVRDLALNVAANFPAKPVMPWDFDNFFAIGAAVDSHHADDRVLLGLSLPIDPNSTLDPGHFVLEVDGSQIDVQTVTSLHEDSGMGVLDLGLAERVTDPASVVTLEYLPGGDPVLSARDGTALEPFERPVVLMLASDGASATVEPGVPLSTATSGQPTPGDPVATTVTSPTGGEVTIQETSVSQPSAVGYEFFGQEVAITAPNALAADPLVIKFEIDASLVPAGQNHTTIALFRNGVLVPACNPETPGVADPPSCVSNRTALADGDVSITVLTIEASNWNLAVLVPIEDWFGDAAGQIRAILQANPGPSSDKLEDALEKVEEALAEFAKMPPDRVAALGNVEGAVGDLEAAVKDGLLEAAVGEDLMDRMSGGALALAEEAIAEAEARGADPAKVAEARRARDVGDARREAGRFKAAIAKYRDALSKADDA